MSGMDSRPIQSRYNYVQDAEPAFRKDGVLWVDTSGNNLERNIRSGGAWELIEAYGPDTPSYPVGGSRWRSTEGNNVEDYYHDGAAWKLIRAVGPDNPSHQIEGSLWFDTGETELKRYDGAAWGSVSVTDHGNLSGLGDDDHAQYVLATDFATENGTFTIDNLNDGTDTVTLANTYDASIFLPSVTLEFDAGGGGSSNEASAWIDAINTDGNGDVTGFNVGWHTADVGGTVHWYTLGVTV